MAQVRSQTVGLIELNTEASADEAVLLLKPVEAHRERATVADRRFREAAGSGNRRSCHEEYLGDRSIDDRVMIGANLERLAADLRLELEELLRRLAAGIGEPSCRPQP